MRRRLGAQVGKRVFDAHIAARRGVRLKPDVEGIATGCKFNPPRGKVASRYRSVARACVTHCGVLDQKRSAGTNNNAPVQTGLDKTVADRYVRRLDVQAGAAAAIENLARNHRASGGNS